MSLMNDMLRDLEKRQAPDRTQQVEAQGYGALTQNTDNHSSRAVILLLGVIIALLLALAVGWWYLQTSSQPALEIDSSNVIVSETVAEAPVVNKAASVNQMPATKGPSVIEHRSVDSKATAPLANAESQKIVESQPVGVTASTESQTESQTAKAHMPKAVTPQSEPVITEPTQKVVNKHGKEPLRSQATVAASSNQRASSKIVKPQDVKTKTASKASIQKTVKAPATPAKNEQPKQVALSKVQVISPALRDEKNAKLVSEMVDAGQRVTGKEKLKAFIAAHNTDTQSRALLATLLMQDGDMAGANELLTDDKLMVSSHLKRLKAHWLAQSGQPDEAIALLNRDRPDIEVDPEYHVLLAALYQQQGFSDEAVAAYAELLSYNPKVADWWAGMAIALDSSQQYPSAKKAYQKALKMEGLRFELADFAKQRLATLGG